MKIMAIDYGDAHTGVAFSDPTGFLTGTTTTIHSRSADGVLSELARLAKEQGAEEIVMGFPRNMDGTEGPRAELYRAFDMTYDYDIWPWFEGCLTGRNTLQQYIDMERAAHHPGCPPHFTAGGQERQKAQENRRRSSRLPHSGGLPGL